MAGEASAITKLTVTGLGNTVELTNTKTLTTPIEQAGSYTVMSTAQVTALQISELAPQIALTKMYSLYIKAEVGTIYVKPNLASTSTFDETGAVLELKEGRSTEIPLNPANNAGVAIDAAAITDAMTWHVLGKA